MPTRESLWELVEGSLRAHPDRADKWHADDLRVHPNTVHNARRRMEADGRLEPVDVVIRRNGAALPLPRRRRPT